MKVIVVGGGIGGMAAALSLHAAGIGASVHEAAPNIAALGLGIHLQPNAVRELTELGVADALDKQAVAIRELAFYSRRGQRIWSEPRGRDAGYRWPQYAINRGTLQVVLLEAAKARLGAEHIHTGHRLVSFEQDANGVTAHFVDSTTGASLPPVRGDVLVAADGIHSAVRKHYYPDQTLQFGGQLMWRSAVKADRFFDGSTMIIAGHRNQKLVCYPMLKLPDGRLLLNWIAELGASGDGPPREEWNRRVDASKFAGAFSEWKFDWLDVPALMASPSDVFEFPKVDRDPIDRWTFGRVTMLGDAAHPMHPVGSQAGSQAVVDGRSLAWHLAKHRDDPAAGLLAYEAERLPPMREIALQNRTLGPEVVMEIVEERAPNGFHHIHDVLSAEDLQARADAFKHMAGFAVESLNNRASYDVPQQ
ncbi:flavin-dependent oxidoreductase [Pandoraea anhela]|uniref:Monooxygenase n=1 Tax=Pandoraea anhela TaxID=2508295 RepID=A0A5E4X3Z8_9BURK|nr:flavin-dependent oxidoreductase [Pandoraea anhela]VVE30885.1 monooxygenase [Pandoraea anhela]